MHLIQHALAGDPGLISFQSLAEKVRPKVTPEHAFLSGKTFAVAGASNNREKYGNIVFRHLTEYLEGDHERVVYPIHPQLELVEGITAYKSVGELPAGGAESLSIVTPPAVTRAIVGEAIEAGVKSIWMQPGAEDGQAINAAKDAGINVIAGGPCILVVMKTNPRRP